MELLIWLLSGIFDPLLKRLDKRRNRRFREAELEREGDQTTPPSERDTSR